MLFYYMVVQAKDGIKNKPVIMNETELQNTIEQWWAESLQAESSSDSEYTITTEKAGWYKVNFGSKKNYIRYKTIK
jgi:hypothetical protein